MRTDLKTTELCRIAVSAALIAVCAWITVPAAIPFTMQTFGIFCVLNLLGGRKGTLAILIYLLIGAAGLPVFSGFQGGIGILLGTTGGYLVGFLWIGLVFRTAEKCFGSTLRVRVAALLLGLVLCYAFGTGWFLFLYARRSGPIGIGTALGWCVLPFLLPDLGKLALGVLLSERIRNRQRIV